MKAARLHAYGQFPIVEDVAEPAVSGPLDVVVRVGGRVVAHARARHTRA